MSVSLEEFEKRLKEKHPELKIISEYKNLSTSIKVKCKCGQLIEKEANYFLKVKNVCSVCSTVCERHKSIGNDGFIKLVNKKFGNAIDYSLLDYKSKNKKVILICKFCNEKFEVTPKNYLNYKYSCLNPLCEKSAKNGIHLTDEQFKKIVENKFKGMITILTDYKNSKQPIKIKCNICLREKTVLPNTLLLNKGCMHGKKSFGELTLEKILNDLNINFEREKWFKDCRDILPLPFDFYLPDYNLLIEYQGKQHYEPRKEFGGKKGFEKLKLHDQIKRDYCKNNNIRELEIPYWKSREIKNIIIENLCLR